MSLYSHLLRIGSNGRIVIFQVSLRVCPPVLLYVWPHTCFSSKRFKLTSRLSALWPWPSCGYGYSPAEGSVVRTHLLSFYHRLEKNSLWGCTVHFRHTRTVSTLYLVHQTCPLYSRVIGATTTFPWQDSSLNVTLISIFNIWKCLCLTNYALYLDELAVAV